MHLYSYVGLPVPLARDLAEAETWQVWFLFMTEAGEEKNKLESCKVTEGRRGR